MSVLYVTQPEAILAKKRESFSLSLKQDDNGWEKHSIAVQTVEQIVLMGNPQVTGDALIYALELGVSVHYLSIFGKYLGAALPAGSRNGQLRLLQYKAYVDRDKRLAISKIIVAAKIHNQHRLLSRRNVQENSLKIDKSKAKLQSSLDALRGIEGTAARTYFSHWSEMLPPGWSFPNRNRRPPTDPVNSLLSFAYGLLRVQVTTAVHLAGLDPYVGYLHEATRGQPAMVLDLMEEFRAPIADSVVLSTINNGEIQHSDFQESLGAYRLKDDGRKRFLQAFDRKMNDEFKHPIFNYRCTYRSAIELQGRLLARHLQENLPYKPFKP